MGNVLQSGKNLFESLLNIYNQIKDLTKEASQNFHDSLEELNKVTKNFLEILDSKDEDWAKWLNELLCSENSLFQQKTLALQTINLLAQEKNVTAKGFVLSSLTTNYFLHEVVAKEIERKKEIIQLEQDIYPREKLPANSVWIKAAEETSAQRAKLYATSQELSQQFLPENVTKLKEQEAQNYCPKIIELVKQLFLWNVQLKLEKLEECLRDNKIDYQFIFNDKYKFREYIKNVDYEFLDDYKNETIDWITKNQEEIRKRGKKELDDEQNKTKQKIMNDNWRKLYQDLNQIYWGSGEPKSNFLTVHEILWETREGGPGLSQETAEETLAIYRNFLTKTGHSPEQIKTILNQLSKTNDPHYSPLNLGEIIQEISIEIAEAIRAAGYKGIEIIRPFCPGGEFTWDQEPADLAFSLLNENIAEAREDDFKTLKEEVTKELQLIKKSLEQTKEIDLLNSIWQSLGKGRIERRYSWGQLMKRSSTNSLERSQDLENAIDALLGNFTRQNLEKVEKISKNNNWVFHLFDKEESSWGKSKEENIDHLLNEERIRRLKELWEKIDRKETDKESWENIHPDFTLELKKQWEKKNWTEAQVQDWINAGLAPKDADFATYLRNVKNFDANKMLDEGNFEVLQVEYEKWRESFPTYTDEEAYTHSPAPRSNLSNKSSYSFLPSPGSGNLSKQNSAESLINSGHELKKKTSDIEKKLRRLSIRLGKEEEEEEEITPYFGPSNFNQAEMDAAEARLNNSPNLVESDRNDWIVFRDNHYAAIETLQFQFVGYVNQINKLEEHVKWLEGQIEEKKEKIDDLNKIKTDKGKKADDLEKEKKGLEDELDKAKKELVKKEKEGKNLEDRIKRLQNDLATVEGELTNNNEFNARLVGIIRKLNQKLGVISYNKDNEIEGVNDSQVRIYQDILRLARDLSIITEANGVSHFNTAKITQITERINFLDDVNQFFPIFNENGSFNNENITRLLNLITSANGIRTSVVNLNTRILEALGEEGTPILDGSQLDAVLTIVRNNLETLITKSNNISEIKDGYETKIRRINDWTDEHEIPNEWDMDVEFWKQTHDNLPETNRTMREALNNSGVNNADQGINETNFAYNRRLAQKLINREGNGEAETKLKQFLGIPNLNAYNETNGNGAWQRVVDNWVAVNQILEINNGNVRTFRAELGGEEGVSLRELLNWKNIDFPQAKTSAVRLLGNAKGDITNQALNREVGELDNFFPADERWENFINSAGSIPELVSRTNSVSRAILNLKTDLTAAKTAARQRLDTLRGALDNNDLKDQINDGQDPVIIADGQTWVQKLEGHAITTAQELDTYTGQVESAIRTLNLSAAKTAARQRLDTLRGALDNNDLKDQINDGQDPVIIADGQTWVQKLEGHAITTAQELDTYTGQVESAIRTLNLSAAKTAARQRLDTLRGALDNNDLKDQINDGQDPVIIADGQTWVQKLEGHAITTAQELDTYTGQVESAIRTLNLSAAKTAARQRLDTLRGALDNNDLKDQINDGQDPVIIADGQTWVQKLEGHAITTAQELDTYTGQVESAIRTLNLSAAKTAARQRLDTLRGALDNNDLKDQINDGQDPVIIADGQTWVQKLEGHAITTAQELDTYTGQVESAIRTLNLSAAKTAARQRLDTLRGALDNNDLKDQINDGQDPVIIADGQTWVQKLEGHAITTAQELDTYTGQVESAIRTLNLSAAKTAARQRLDTLRGALDNNDLKDQINDGQDPVIIADGQTWVQKLEGHAITTAQELDTYTGQVESAIRTLNLSAAKTAARQRLDTLRGALDNNDLKDQINDGQDPVIIADGQTWVQKLEGHAITTAQELDTYTGQVESAIRTLNLSAAKTAARQRLDTLRGALDNNDLKDQINDGQDPVIIADGQTWVQKLEGHAITTAQELDTYTGQVESAIRTLNLSAAKTAARQRLDTLRGALDNNDLKDQINDGQDPVIIADGQTWVQKLEGHAITTAQELDTYTGQVESAIRTLNLSAAKTAARQRLDTLRGALDNNDLKDQINDGQDPVIIADGQTWVQKLEGHAITTAQELDTYTGQVESAIRTLNLSAAKTAARQRLDTLRGALDNNDLKDQINDGQDPVIIADGQTWVQKLEGHAITTAQELDTYTGQVESAIRTLNLSAAKTAARQRLDTLRGALDNNDLKDQINDGQDPVIIADGQTWVQKLEGHAITTAQELDTYTGQVESAIRTLNLSAAKTAARQRLDTLRGALDNNDLKDQINDGQDPVIIADGQTWVQKLEGHAITTAQELDTYTGQVESAIRTLNLSAAKTAARQRLDTLRGALDNNDLKDQINDGQDPVIIADGQTWVQKLEGHAITTAQELDTYTGQVESAIRTLNLSAAKTAARQRLDTLRGALDNNDLKDQINDGQDPVIIADGQTWVQKLEGHAITTAQELDTYTGQVESAIRTLNLSAAKTAARQRLDTLRGALDNNDLKDQINDGQDPVIIADGQTWVQKLEGHAITTAQELDTYTGQVESAIRTLNLSAAKTAARQRLDTLRGALDNNDLKDQINDGQDPVIIADGQTWVQKLEGHAITTAQELDTYTGQVESAIRTLNLSAAKTAARQRLDTLRGALDNNDLKDQINDGQDPVIIADGQTWVQKLEGHAITTAQELDTYTGQVESAIRTLNLSAAKTAARQRLDTLRGALDNNDLKDQINDGQDPVIIADGQTWVQKLEGHAITTAQELDTYTGQVESAIRTLNLSAAKTAARQRLDTLRGALDNNDLKDQINDGQDPVIIADGQTWVQKLEGHAITTAQELDTYTGQVESAIRTLNLSAAKTAARQRLDTLRGALDNNDLKDQINDGQDPVIIADGQTWVQKLEGHAITTAQELDTYTGQVESAIRTLNLSAAKTAARQRLDTLRGALDNNDLKDQINDGQDPVIIADGQTWVQKLEGHAITTAQELDTYTGQVESAIRTLNLSAAKTAARQRLDTLRGALDNNDLKDQINDGQDPVIIADGQTWVQKLEGHAITTAQELDTYTGQVESAIRTLNLSAAKTAARQRLDTLRGALDNNDLKDQINDGQDPVIIADGQTWVQKLEGHAITTAQELDTYTGQVESAIRTLNLSAAKTAARQRLDTLRGALDNNDLKDQINDGQDPVIIADGQTWVQKLEGHAITTAQELDTYTGQVESAIRTLNLSAAKTAARQRLDTLRGALDNNDLKDQINDGQDPVIIADGQTWVQKLEGHAITTAQELDTYTGQVESAIRTLNLSAAKTAARQRLDTLRGALDNNDLKDQINDGQDPVIIADGQTWVQKLEGHAITTAQELDTYTGQVESAIRTLNLSAAKTAARQRLDTLRGALDNNDLKDQINDGQDPVIIADGQTWVQKLEGHAITTAQELDTYTGQVESAIRTLNLSAAKTAARQRLDTLRGALDNNDLKDQINDGQDPVIIADGQTWVQKLEGHAITTAQELDTYTGQVESAIRTLNLSAAKTAARQRLDTLRGALDNNDLKDQINDGQDPVIIADGQTWVQKLEGHAITTAQELDTYTGQVESAIRTLNLSAAKTAARQRLDTLRGALDNNDLKDQINDGQDPVIIADGQTWVQKLEGHAITTAQELDTYTGQVESAIRTLNLSAAKTAARQRLDTLRGALDNNDLKDQINDGQDPVIIADGQTWVQKLEGHAITTAQELDTYTGQVESAIRTLNLSAAKTAARQRLDTLRGALDNNDLKDQINDGQDPVIIADGQTWVQKLEGHAITTAQELDTYTGQVESAIRTLNLSAAKTAARQRLDTLRGALDNNDLKDQINDGQDPVIIADGQTWVQKLEGHAITTAQELDTYTGQVESAIRTLNLSAAKTAARQRLDTLRGALDNNDLKDQINDGQDPVIIADGQTWVQKLEGHAITTAQELDTYTGQVESAIRTLNLSAAKTAARQRLDTLRGALDNNDLKDQINDGQDPVIIADGQTWVQKLEGHAITTAQELDTYTGQVESAIRTLNLSAAKAAAINRIETARAANPAITHAILKVKINRDAENIADPNVESANAWHAWINDASATELTKREGKAFKAMGLLRKETIQTDLNTIETHLTNLRDATGRINITTLQNYLDAHNRLPIYENYLQTQLQITNLNNLPNNNTGQSLNQLINFYNDDKTRVKTVIEQFRDDQGINDNDLNNQLIVNSRLVTTNWQGYINNATNTADLAQRKLNVLNSIAELVKVNPTLNDIIQHAIWQVEKALDANGIYDDANNANGTLTKKLREYGDINNQTDTWKDYLNNATAADYKEREKKVLYAVVRLSIEKEISSLNNNSPACSHSDYDDLKKQKRQLEKDRDAAIKDRDNYHQQLSQQEQQIVQQLNNSLKLGLNKNEKDLNKAIVEIQKLIYFDPIAPSVPPVNNQALQEQLHEANKTIVQLQNQLKQKDTPFGESIKEIIKIDEKLLNENQALKIELEKQVSNYEQFAKDRNKAVMKQIKEVNVEKIIQLVPQAKKEAVKESIEKSANYAELAENRNQIITKYIQQNSNNLQEIQQQQQQQQQQKERTILISLLVVSLVSVGGLLVKLKGGKKLKK